jgi:hypothetical protein
MPVQGDPAQNGSRSVKLAAKQAALLARASMRSAGNSLGVTTNPADNGADPSDGGTCGAHV